jgi:hypothetical protein
MSQSNWALTQWHFKALTQATRSSTQQLLPTDCHSGPQAPQAQLQYRELPPRAATPLLLGAARLQRGGRGRAHAAYAPSTPQRGSHTLPAATVTSTPHALTFAPSPSRPLPPSFDTPLLHANSDPTQSRPASLHHGRSLRGPQAGPQCGPADGPARLRARPVLTPSGDSAAGAPPPSTGPAPPIPIESRRPCGAFPLPTPRLGPSPWAWRSKQWPAYAPSRLSLRARDAARQHEPKGVGGWGG